MLDEYIMINKIPHKSSHKEWCEWFQTANRTVQFDKIGDISVSTVFLGIDHQFGDGPPLLFETLIFGGVFDGDMFRSSTYDEAKISHFFMCEKAFIDQIELSTVTQKQKFEIGKRLSRKIDTGNAQ